MRVKLSDLERSNRSRASQEEVHPEAAYEAADKPAAVSPGIELDLRGLTGEEGVARLEDYLDRASRAALPFVRIIHGKGTGALRRAIRNAIKDNPLVKSFETGQEGEGGDGVTRRQTERTVITIGNTWTKQRPLRAILILGTIALTIVIIERLWAFGETLQSVLSTVAGAWLLAFSVRPFIDALHRATFPAPILHWIERRYGAKWARYIGRWRLPYGIAVAIVYVMLGGRGGGGWRRSASPRSSRRPQT